MPFSRFYKLPIEKRERLMEAAAQEFAAYGFDDASVNRILETVQMSHRSSTALPSNEG